MRRLAALAGVLLVPALIVGCGGSGGAGEAKLPPANVKAVEPQQPQLLAFVAGRRIGVVEGNRIRYVAKLAPGDVPIELDWSGDGRQLAWTVSRREEEVGLTLEMVDVETGARRAWHSVTGSPDPGLEGIVVADYHGRFIEYLPDGERLIFPFHLHHLRRPGYPSTTGVDAVMPFRDRWLVLGEYTVFSGRGGPVRGFLYDPQTARFSQVAKGIGFPAEPTPLEGGGAAWIERRSGSACLEGDEIGSIGNEVPALPPHADEHGWGVRRLITARGISLLALRTGDWIGSPENLECDDDPSYSWLELKDGDWVTREQGLLDLDLAADGRIARVRGSICNEDEACPQSIYMHAATSEATLEDPASDQVVTLPRNTVQVRFSPAHQAAAPDYSGEGPALSPAMRLDMGGFGPLRMGMSPTEMQSGTSTPLTFQLDAAGCGTITPTDYLTNRELGFEGEIRSDRLAAIRVTTLDGPPKVDEYEDADEEPDPLSDLQPGVGSVRARGPQIDGALRAGDTVDLMLERLGRPADETGLTPTDAVDYSYELDGGSLLAHADGAGTLRRLELRAEPTPPC